MAHRTVVALLVLLMAGSVWADAVSKNASGNRLFKKGRYNEALSRYSAGLLKDPSSDVLHYNSGGALYKLNDYQKSLEEYQKASGFKDKLTKSRDWYNIGNARFKLDQWQEAIDAYVECLKLNPDDQDAKFNLELIRKKIKQNAKPQGGQGQQQQNQNQKGQGKDKKSGQKDGQKGQQQGQEKDQPDQKDGKQGQDKNKMSKEDAERVLDAVLQDEKDSMEKAHEKRAVIGGSRAVDKDW
jgi:Ca-activated chloride channel homolog